MKNNKNEGEESSEVFDEKQLKKLVVFAAVGLKLGRRILDKLQSVEDSVEIISREIARQLENQD